MVGGIVEDPGRSQGAGKPTVVTTDNREIFPGRESLEPRPATHLPDPE
jgi:hypothetical protein